MGDLFGGQALGGPYRWALGLSADSPRHYDFGLLGSQRRQSIEQIYQALNEAGEQLGSEAARDAVVDEAVKAFGCNVRVYKEEGRLFSDGTVGILKMAYGFAKSQLVR